MRTRTKTHLALAVVLIGFAACAEPLAPAKNVAGVPKLSELAQEVKTAAKKKGKRVLRRGRPDELVLDVTNSTLSARGRTVRIPQEHLAMMVESFDGINVLDQFFQALHRDPKYRESDEAGKSSKVRLRADVARAGQAGASQTFAPSMSVMVGTPTTSSISTVTVDVSVSGANCAALNATLSDLYTAFNNLKDSWEERAIQAALFPAAGGLYTILEDPSADLGTGAGVTAAMLFAEMAVIWSEILHMKLSISIFEGMMVAAGCVTVLPPVLVVPDPPTSGGGSGDEEMCYYHYRLWRSEDGGLTFYLVAESITIAPC